MPDKKTSYRQIEELQAQLEAKERMCLELSRKLARTKGLEERLLSALAIAGLGTWEYDAGRALSAFDRKSAEIFGIAEGLPLTNDHIFALIHPDDRPRVEREMQHSIATGSPYHTEYRILRPDGQLRWIAVRGHSVRFSDESGGDRSRFVGTLRDITEQRLAERERDRFFDLSLDLLAITSTRSGYFRRVNPAFSRLLGWSEEELLASPLLDFVHPDDWAKSQGAYEDLVSGRDLTGFENRVRCKDGTYRLINWNSVSFPTSGLAYCVGRDMTAASQAKESLARHRELLQAIFDNIPILLVLWDPQLHTFSLNRHTEATIGWTTEDANEGDFMSKVYPDPEYRGQVAAYMQSLASGWHEWLVTTKAGDRVPIDWANIHLADEVMIGIGVDLRERRRAEEQLRALNDELERRVEIRTRELQETQAQYLHAEKLSAIGKLSASIAHEFNNPLQAIMTILTGLNKTSTLHEEEKRFLELAVGEAGRMKNLIRNLQDFHRPSSDTKTPMDLHAAIDSLMLLCKNDFKRKKISIVLRYAEDLPRVVAVPDQIKQVLINLLNNAADACGEKDGEIIVRTFVEKGRVGVAIRDNGTGIAPGQMDRIFQPFFTTKSNVKGTGLGLSICHGIVQYHNGEIRVASEPGRGSTFTVLLPVAATEEAGGNN